jgi:dolichyl-phosphate-mannose--protein O-mannosyl transferase
MEEFHSHLTTPHSYESAPWTWLLLKRPVSYYFCPNTGCPSLAANQYSEVMTLGNPFTWWIGLIALLFTLGAWMRGLFGSSKDGSALWMRPEGTILAGFGFAYLPWLVLAGNRPAVFIFYVLPALPFLYLSLAYCGIRLGRSWPARSTAAVFAAITVLLFVYYYPLMANVPLSKSAWNQRMLAFDGSTEIDLHLFGLTLATFHHSNWCAVTQSRPTSSATTFGSAGAKITSTESSSTSASEPPSGWCWI